MTKSLLKSILTTFAIWMCVQGAGQVPQGNYFRLMREGDTLYVKGLYGEAAGKMALVYRNPTAKYRP